MTQSEDKGIGVTVAHVILCDCPTCNWYEASWCDTDPYEDTPHSGSVLVMPTDGGLILLSAGFLPRYRMVDTDDSTFVGPWYSFHPDGLFTPMQ